MPPPFQTTADAVDRETAWLTTGPGQDSLPVLLSDGGGRWDAIQAYVPRTAAQRKNQIFVLRPKMQIERFGNVRSIVHYRFELHLMWTLSSGQGSAEDDQRAFDLAINDLVMRVRGIPPGVTATNPSGQADKTHNGNFLSVAENPSQIDVDWIEPLPYMVNAAFAATCTYMADDWDFND